jgi:hypothetical protein
VFGGSGIDRLKVIGGSRNLLDGGGGRDSFQGGSGDDNFVIDADDLLLPGLTMDGAEGEDAILVDFDLDLTAIDDRRITNIEQVDLTNGASNRLTLSFEDVLAIQDDARTLFVEGDGTCETGSAADAAFPVGNWTGGQTVDGSNAFMFAGATVHIDVEVTTEVLVA